MMHESVGHFWEHGTSAFVSELQKSRTGREASLECMSTMQNENYQGGRRNTKIPKLRIVGASTSFSA